MDENFQKTFGETAGYKLGMWALDEFDRIDRAYAAARKSPDFGYYTDALNCLVIVGASVIEGMAETCVREAIDWVNRPTFGRGSCHQD